MKKLSILFLVFVAGVTLSCGKEDDIVDCLVESALLDVHHSVSGDNVKQINFNITYYGDHSLKENVKWNFGDGTGIQTISGITASHIYANAGSYEVKAVVKISGGCSYDLKESITVE
ncbi:MAG: PKD domain-containing protein [Bacteroidota bacterium]